MLAEQILARGIHAPRLLEAIGSVPRHVFVPPDLQEQAYADMALPIGYGQTISQPYIVAVMIELLEVTASDRVLEIGCGCGYQAAVLAELAAQVHTVDIIPELAVQAEKVLAGLGYASIHVHIGDGSAGWPEAAPYDRILVAAAAPEAPQVMVDQLAVGGRMVIPVGGRSVQQLEVWHRRPNGFERTKSLEVCFVPLVGQFGWN